MYNHDIKERFLTELPNDDLRVIYTSIFKRTDEFETSVGKDIMDFSLDECLDLLMYLNPKSITAVGTYKSQFHKYASWGITKKLTKEQKNFWIIISSDSDFIKASFNKRYVKDIDELTNIVESTLNAPYDKYVAYLLFSGIMGDYFHEISNLKEDDVRTDLKTIDIPRRKFNTIIEPLHDLIINPGNWYEKKKRDETSEYFIKPFLTKGMEGKPVGTQYIYRVFAKMNENYFEEKGERRFFVPMTIWRSGLFYTLRTIEQSKGSIVSDDYRYTCEIYGKDIEHIGISTLSKEYETYKEVFWNE